MPEHPIPQTPENSPPFSPEKQFASQTCCLCGIPVGRSKVNEVLDRQTFSFCCPGCRQIFLLLFNSPGGLPSNFRDTELYRACVEAGIIPRQENGREPSPTSEEVPFPPLNLALKVEGMWCPSCSWLIEEVLRRTRGIAEAQVSFLSDIIQVKYFPHILSPQEITSRISRLGFRPLPFEEAPAGIPEKRNLLIRLGISGILTANIMMVSAALYFGFLQDLTPKVIAYFSYPLGLLAAPVVFYGGLPILRRGWAGARFGAPSMDTLISVGALAAFFYSVLQTARGSLHLYFDTAAMLITFVLLGKYIESYARDKVAAGITELYNLSRLKARISRSSLMGGVKEKWVSSEGLSPGDEFLVWAGERISLDGRVVSGQGEVDESILTGEARPIRKKSGDEVMGGTLLLNGDLTIRTTRVGAESSLGQMIALMQDALARKNPAEVLADRITHWFVPAIVLLAFVTSLYLAFSQRSLEEALLRGLTVLLISCPCALGLATPIVKLAVMGLARKQGILIRDPGVLERACRLDTVVFDKTGTLTEGKFSLQHIFTTDGKEDEALARISALESRSDHFLAREVVRRAREKSSTPYEVIDFEFLEGKGVKGRVRGDLVWAGNRRLLNALKPESALEVEEKAIAFEKEGRTVVFFGWGKELKGFLVFGDRLRKGIREMVEKLRSRSIPARIVSGDGEETTAAVAEEAGIRDPFGQALPQDKVVYIRTLQDEGYHVGMVGDGMNDAPALAQADVGFAVGTGTHILREASDFTFLAQDPTKVLQALTLSKLAMKAIRQNLFFAFFYNCLAIPLAMAGFLNPLIAVAAMFVSSLTVIGNAVRISRQEISNELSPQDHLSPSYAPSSEVDMPKPDEHIKRNQEDRK